MWLELAASGLFTLQLLAAGWAAYRAWRDEKRRRSLAVAAGALTICAAAVALVVPLISGSGPDDAAPTFPPDAIDGSKAHEGPADRPARTLPPKPPVVEHYSGAMSAEMLARLRLESRRHVRHVDRPDIPEILVSGSRQAFVGVHTASVRGKEDLGPRTLRADQPATLVYQMKPPGEVAEGEAQTEPSPSLLKAIADGAYVEVVFSCNVCDETDREQPAQRLLVDRKAFAKDGTLRSRALVFNFTARMPEAYLSAPGRGPHASLAFRIDGRDLDLWIIPVRVLAAGEARGNRSGEARAAPARPVSAVLRGADDRVRIRFERSTAGVYEVVVKGPDALWPWLKHLPDAARPSGGGYFVSEPIPTRYRAEAANRLGDALQRRVELAVTTAGEDRLDCAIPAGDAVVAAAAFRVCIRDRAEELRALLLPGPVQQLLFELARCEPATASDETPEEPPVVVFDNIPYLPLQFLSVDTGRACAAGLRPRQRPADDGSALSDDYLGLLLPIVVQPIGATNAFRTPRDVATAPPARAPEESEDGPRLLGAVYRERPLPGATEPPPVAEGFEYFETMAMRLQKLDDSFVARNSKQFLEQLVGRRSTLEIVVVNAHGRRMGGSGERAVPSDQIIFSDVSKFGGPVPNVPAEAWTDADTINGKFGGLPDGDTGLRQHPAVVLLACDTAAYGSPNSLPFAFIYAGAGAVLATDVVVDSGLADRFGEALLDAFREEEPVRATLRARRKLLLDQQTVLALLWSVVAPQAQPQQ